MLKESDLDRIIDERGRLVLGEIGRPGDEEAVAALGADMGILYHTSYYSVPWAAGLLPFSNPNETIRQMAMTLLLREPVLPIAAAVCGTEPFRLFDDYLRDLREAGVGWIQNFPTVGLIDGHFRSSLEEIRYSYRKECSLMQKSLAEGLACLPLAFNLPEGLQMAETGAKKLILHPGARFMDAPPEAELFLRIAELARAAREIRKAYPGCRVLLDVSDMDRLSLMEEAAEAGGGGFSGLCCHVTPSRTRGEAVR